MIRQQQLVERVLEYNPDADEDLLNRAFVFSMRAHGSQTRADGGPYFHHPIEVAGILSEMKLDVASIATALLHDTVEDTGATLEEIEKNFGTEVTRLVDGVTKLSKIKLKSDSANQAENFRKLVLAMSEDIRVVLIKLADRLHNMRTLHFLPRPEKRRRIALETLEIYAPLAERLGIQAIKDELEDLAFGELYPEARESILSRLAYLRSEGGDLVDRICTKLKERLAADGLIVSVLGREKTPYSIWRKMQRKNVAFEQLADIMAFRLMVDNREQCYHALGLIHSYYPVVPDRMKDFISTPKPNGYRSLHTTIFGPERQRIEIQIRTHEMHEVAEYGVAAHWAYKQNQVIQGKEQRWLRELLDILEHAQKPEEFLEHTKLELFQDQVFCFTPKGDLINLPSGATPVDFAYAIHSKVGDTCVGAKVNGRIVQLSSRLNNGDQVEIIRSKNQTPSPTWERFVVTGKARARIRRFIRQRQRDEYASLGKAMLQKLFRQEGCDFSEKACTGVLKQLKQPTVEDLYAAVGSGILMARGDVFNAVFPDHNRPEGTQGDDETFKPVTLKRKNDKYKTGPLPIKGLIPGMAVHYARCCHPLPGDRIVGIITTGKGVTIHTIDCETLESFQETPERWLDVAWDDETVVPESHVGRIAIVLMNEKGALGTMTTVIGKNNGNIVNFKTTNRTVDFWEVLIDIEVKHARHLNDIIAALRATPVIIDVERSKGR